MMKIYSLTYNNSKIIIYSIYKIRNNLKNNNNNNNNDNNNTMIRLLFSITEGIVMPSNIAYVKSYLIHPLAHVRGTDALCSVIIR